MVKNKNIIVKILNKNKNINRGIVAALLIGTIHYLLHAIAELPFIDVGYWLVVVIFVYLAFIEDKLFK